MARRGRGRHRNHNRGDGRQDQGQARPDQRQQNNHGQRPPQGADAQRMRQDKPAHGKASITSITQPKRQLSRPAGELAVAPQKRDRSYKVVFFDTLAQARSDFENLKQLAQGCDQLNIVVKAEGPMDDAELNSIGKLFCGAAWALIHERRNADGWYDASHE
jgi:hypothetical protein